MTTDPKHEEKRQARKFKAETWDTLEVIHTKLLSIQAKAANRHQDRLAIRIREALDAVVAAKAEVA